MPRPQSNPPALHLAPALDLDQLPTYATRETLAQIGTRYYFPISPRTIRERWPLIWYEANGRLVARVADFVAEAQKRLDDARVVVGPGAQQQQDQHTA